MLEAIEKLMKDNPEKIAALGIGTSGSVHPVTGEIVGAGDTIKGWRGFKLKEKLSERLSIPIFIDNDVNVAALGEGWLGAAQQLRDYAYVAIGTGLGGALVHSDKIITGVNGGAGEFGHMILYPCGIPCGCGKSGCVEKYVSGTALNLRAREIAPDWDSYKLFELFRQQDERAVELIHNFVQDLSIVLANIQYMYDPETIVLGGGVGEAYPLWETELSVALQKVSSKKKVNVSLSKLGGNAGVLGAARLAINGLLS